MDNVCTHTYTYISTMLCNSGAMQITTFNHYSLIDEYPIGDIIFLYSLHLIAYVRTQTDIYIFYLS